MAKAGDKYSLAPHDRRYGKITTNELFAVPLEQLGLELLKDMKPSVFNFFFLGSRGSGKTNSIIDIVFIKLFLSLPGENIFYYVRQKHVQLEDLKKQLFGDMFHDYGFKVEQGKNMKGGSINTLEFKRNKMIFQTLNHDKIKLSSGGSVGQTTGSRARRIFVFYEECSQLTEDLVNVHYDSIRGGTNTHKIMWAASNPGSADHWFVRLMERNLPTNKQELEMKGYQRTFGTHTTGQAALYIRNNILTNPYAPASMVEKLASYEHNNLNAYNICFLGMSGVLDNAIYANSFYKSFDVDYKDFISNRKVGKFHVGIDWGDGRSIYASPTTIHLAKIHPVIGMQVIREETIGNNGDGDTNAAKGLSTVELFDAIITVLLRGGNEFKEPFKCFIDSAALGDFSDMLNNRMRGRRGKIYPTQIDCVSADKSMKIQDRVLTVNLQLATGLVRIDRDQCPRLAEALINMALIESANPNEESKYLRDHKYSHGINSGVEYIQGDFLYLSSRTWSEIYEV